MRCSICNDRGYIFKEEEPSGYDPYSRIEYFKELCNCKEIDNGISSKDSRNPQTNTESE